MKKFLAILTVCALCVSALGTTAFAQNSATQLPTDSWEVVGCGDDALEGYENYPEPPNAEPNWNDTAATASDSLPSDSWEIDVECGEPIEGYENLPELPNAEPNWNDTPATANAADSLPSDTWEIVGCGGEPLEGYENLPELPNAEPNWEDSAVVSRAASIRVDIQSPLETSWRNTHSNDYYYQANRVVERIDDYLARKFGIDFYSVSQPHWSTNTTSNYSAVLSDVTNRIGKGNADLMIAFAGPLVDTSTSKTFGVAYVGQPYALVFDHDFTQNCKSAQHEVGHTYGLQHCSNTCVMKQGWDLSWSLFEHLCPNHDTQWNGAKTKY